MDGAFVSEGYGLTLTTIVCAISGLIAHCLMNALASGAAASELDEQAIGGLDLIARRGSGHVHEPLDQPAFNRNRLKAEKLIDSKVLEQLIRIPLDAGCSRLRFRIA